MGCRPCGCDLLREAKSEPGEERTTLEHFAREYQLEWRCPLAGEHAPPKRGDRARLTDECQTALASVEGLIGADEGSFDTCPNWYARQAYVIEAINARWHAEHGGLAEYEPLASQALYDAIHLINAGVMERQNKEALAMRQRADAMADETRLERHGRE